MTVQDVCGFPTDAGFFDESSIAPRPLPGGEAVLAEYQLHPQYCGVLIYFSQFTTEHARDASRVATPSDRWEIRINGVPRSPYLALTHIVNPWGMHGFPLHLRLDAGCRIQFAVTNIGNAAPGAGERVGGRIVGRYWYNEVYGGAVAG